MNLWIETARDSLVETVGGVDCLMLNDAELRQLTRKPNIVRAAREVLALGPAERDRRQAGRVRRGDDHGRRLLRLPAFPLETVVDPTGAGDTFAGGFVGYVAAHADASSTTPLLRRAMAYGTALASFNVEEFGIERVERLTGQEIADRVAELAAADLRSRSDAIELRH